MKNRKSEFIYNGKMRHSMSLENETFKVKLPGTVLNKSGGSNKNLDIKLKLYKKVD